MLIFPVLKPQLYSRTFAGKVSYNVIWSRVEQFIELNRATFNNISYPKVDIFASIKPSLLAVLSVSRKSEIVCRTRMISPGKMHIPFSQVTSNSQLVEVYQRLTVQQRKGKHHCYLPRTVVSLPRGPTRKILLEEYFIEDPSREKNDRIITST